MRGGNLSCKSASICSRHYCVSVYTCVCYCICITVLYTCHGALALSHPSWALWRVKWRMKVSALYLITWNSVIWVCMRPCLPESSTPCVVCNLDLPYDIDLYKVASIFPLTLFWNTGLLNCKNIPKAVLTALLLAVRVGTVCLDCVV